MTDRHPTIQDLAQWFDYEHLPPHLQDVSGECYALAETMLSEIPDSPQLAVGLQHLLEAKDCFVRAAQQRHHLDSIAAAERGHEDRKEAIVEQAERIERSDPSNPTGVQIESSPEYLDSLAREPKGFA